MLQPLVVVSTDVRQFENYTWHATPKQYIEAAVAPGTVRYVARGGIETAVNVGSRRYREILIELK